jgi:pimeloyl-ACP methyl ester carboxylesterase
MSTVFGTAALAARYADDLLVGTVRDVHGAVAKRVWGSLGRTNVRGASSQVVHDRVTGAVYGGLSAGLRGSARACDAADRRGTGPRSAATPRGRFVLSVVNGLIGDRLVEEAPGSAITMSVRVGGRDVPAERGPLAEAFPSATGDLIVFVHGLMEHDESWFRRGNELGSYGDQLAAGGRWTPVYLRFNTGLALSENGVGLASLLDDLVRSWPVPIRRIAMVGHSLGGLVIRAACAVSTDSAEPWNKLVTNVVCLGTPHLGAPLERAVALGSRALGVLPESAPFARILEYRSVGILDLRRGLAADVQNLPHARYHLVAATLGPTVWHPLSLGLGDLMVRHPSAMGRGRHGEMFPGADTLHLPSSDHFDLLNHPDVHRKLNEWLA